MATGLSVIVNVDLARKMNVKVTPSTTMEGILLQVTEKFGLEAQNYVIQNDKNKTLENSLTVRLAGFNSGQKLYLRQKATPLSSSSNSSKEEVVPTKTDSQVENSNKMDVEEKVEQKTEEKKDEEQVKVFLPPSESTDLKVELPDEFYEVSPQELSDQMERDRLAKESNATLKTKEMREKEESQKKDKYLKTTIRIRFRDKTILEATFDSSTTTEQLNQFVKNNIQDSSQTFFLFTTPPPKKLAPKKSLLEQNLAPSALVLVSGDCKIKNELISSATELPVSKNNKTNSPPQSTPETQQASSNSTSTEKPKKSAVPSWFNKGKK